METKKYNLGIYWRLNKDMIWEQCEWNEIMDNTEKSFGVFEGGDCVRLDLLGMIEVEEFVEKYRPHSPSFFGYVCEPIWR